MENPSTWDDIDRALNDIWDAVQEDVAQGICGLSPGRHLRAALENRGYRIVKHDAAQDDKLFKTLEPLGLFKRYTEGE